MFSDDSMGMRGSLIPILAVFLLAACDSRREAVNELGLARSDMELGRPVTVEVLKERTTRIAEAYLLKHQQDLREALGTDAAPTIEYQKIKDLPKLGYRSSFYYFCWDIYLPFRIETQQGAYLLVLQLSDRQPGNSHDVEKFRVVREFIHDDKGRLLIK